MKKKYRTVKRKKRGGTKRKREDDCSEKYLEVISNFFDYIANNYDEIMENDLNRDRYINAENQFQNKIEELNEKCLYKSHRDNILTLAIVVMFENDNKMFSYRLDFDIPVHIYHIIKSELGKLMIVYAKKMSLAAPAAG